MRIQEVELTTFKGITRKFDLDRVAILCGPNGSGKSGLEQAIQFGIEGRTRLGDRPESSFKYAGPNGCSVRVKLDDGFEFTRSLSRDAKKGTISQSLSIAGDQRTSLRDLDPEIRKRADFAEMFNLSLFTDLSADKQRDRILDLCGKARKGAADPKAILHDIAMAFFKLELGEGKVDMAGKMHVGGPAALRGLLLDEMAAAHREAFCSLLHELEADIKGETSEAIGAALAKAKEWANQSKREHDAGVAAAQQLSEQKAGLSVVSQTVAELTARIETLTADREALRGRIENQKGRAAGIEKATKRVEAATTDLRNTEALTGISEAEEAAKLEAEAAAIVVDADAVTVTTADLNLRAAFKLQETFAREHALAEQKIARAKIEIESVDATLAQHASGPWMKALEHIRLIDKAEVHGNSWRVIQELHTFIEGQAGVGVEASLQTRKSNAEMAIEAAKKELADAIEKLGAAERSIASASKSLDEARTNEANAARKLHIENRAVVIRRGLSERIQRVADLKSAKLQAERDLLELQSAGGIANLAEMESNHTAMTLEISSLKGQLDAKTRYAALEAELLRAVAAKEEDLVRHDVAKKTADAIRDLRNKMMDELVRPVIEPMNRFLAVAAPGFTTYVELEERKGEVSKPIFDIGWSDGTRRVPLETLSGGESAIFCAALAYALVMIANPQLRVLMVEAGEIDDAHFDRLMDGLNAVSGDVGNIIVAAWQYSSVDYRGDGVQVIDLSCGEREAVAA